MKLFQSIGGSDCGSVVDTPYDALKAAVVEQAIHDYLCALKSLRKNPDNAKMLKEARSLEAWFRSDDYTVYGTANGNQLIRMCRELVSSDSQYDAERFSA